ncbi:hypothetical protein FRC02_000237 [Tulasnella sp. 418]|nr:hypothetical protein FRC02_000237 [Tulasnella sp. 418]
MATLRASNFAKTDLSVSNHDNKVAEKFLFGLLTPKKNRTRTAQPQSQVSIKSPRLLIQVVSKWLTSLHGVWDGGLITKAIRAIHNYTHPVPERRIENASRRYLRPYVAGSKEDGGNPNITWSLCPEGEGDSSW